jgi:sulfonate transport system substrate-binding protein
MNAGAIDVGGVGDAPFAFARAAGVSAKAITATRSSGASTAIVVPRSSQAQHFADLKGKRIGTGKGSVGHFLVVAARDQAGLAPRDINISFLSPPDAKAALASGNIDAWATWSQYVYLALAQDGARILLDGRGLMSGLSYEVASPAAISGKRPLLAAFVQRLNQALRWGLTNTDLYSKAWAQETQVPVEVARATLQARGFSPVSIDQGVITDQQRTIDLFVREHVLPERDDAAAGFDTSFN